MKELCVACKSAPCRWGYQRCWDCDFDWRSAYQGYITDEEYRRRVAARKTEHGYCDCGSCIGIPPRAA